jgi:NitT/TauT family transport system permease protein
MASTDTTPAQDAGSVEAGLDALETQATGRPTLRQTLVNKILPPVIALAVVLALWALLYPVVDDPSKLPSPAAVGSTFKEAWLQGDLLGYIWTSVSRGLLGFFFALLIGTPLGLIVARVKFIRAAIGPILSIANGLVSGVDQVPPLFLRAGRTMGATGIKGIWHITLPAALPGYVAGLKQGWAFSWRSLMAAEIIAQFPDLGVGLGQLLENGRTNSDMAMVFEAILLILFVGIAIDLLIFSPLERWVLRSRGLLVKS